LQCKELELHLLRHEEGRKSQEEKQNFGVKPESKVSGTTSKDRFSISTVHVELTTPRSKRLAEI
jgi:hypothetical protein